MKSWWTESADQKTWQHRYCCSTYWVAVEVPQEYHPAPRLQNTTRGHTMQFQRFQPVVDALKYAFLPRTIPDWNALPQLVAEADSLDTFKQHLSRHQQFWLAAFCTMHLVHICFTVRLFIAGFSERELFAICYRPSVCRLSSVTFVRPIQTVRIFGNISTALGTLAIHWHPLTISRRSSKGNASAGGVKHKRGSQV